MSRDAQPQVAMSPMSPRLCSALLVAAAGAYRYVLDDRDAILALAERARACRDFVEVRVRVRRHGQKFRARGGASMCEVLRRGKWRGPPPPAVKVALDDSLGPRPAFAPRTGQFVVP